nr:MAG TPA: Polypeptide deformylase [Caudoviricetes sp.]
MGAILNLKDIKKLNTSDIITDYDKLSERCDEFDLTKKNNEAQEIIVKLKQIIRSDETIAGLSAIQIGYNKRIICINFNGDIRTFINPIIEKAEGLELSRESCHSIPGKEYIRIRQNKITVTYQTPLAKIETVELAGMAARVMQHHIDHLDGLLISDVGLEVDEDWDNATDEERQEVIDYYIDSLDIRAKEISKEIAEDGDATQLSNAIKFMNSVREGKTKIEQLPLTDEEIKVIEEYKKEQEEHKE